MNKNEKKKQLINCAIYTRKSCEEGLDQEFNSLDAQYEAGKAYIYSQKSEGWKFYKKYDDGGYSGGNIERPGLKELMKDIEAGYIDCVVVYKVDRLSRSLCDFFKLMEIFEKKNISFVSVTQSFNTTNSMGKLTLNILLSFAQFEREVTSERIRDKISASKKKGMWMGGIRPLGYLVDEKKLIPEEDEARAVNYIFKSYIELKSIGDLKQKLNEENFKTTIWISASGSQYGGRKFTKSILGRLLRNKVYIGKVEHNGNVYEGEHEAIISQELFNEANAILDEQNNRKKSKLEFGKYLLFQKIYDEDGNLFKCDSSIKSSKTKGSNKIRKIRYKYYVSDSKRLKCDKIDKTIVALVRQFISANHKILTPSQNDEFGKINWEQLSGDEQKSLVRILIEKIIYKDEEIKIEIKKDLISNLQNYQFDQQIQNSSREFFKHQIYLSQDKEIINIIADTKTYQIIKSETNKTILNALAKGYKYKKLIESGKAISEISKEENKQGNYISRIANLGYLSPKIIENIFKANHSENLTIKDLEEISSKYLDWKKQEAVFAAI